MEEERSLTRLGGPNTPQGKDAARLNALRHGLRAVALVIPGVEREDDWEDFRQGIVDSLAPADPFESSLSERIAQYSWRLRRVPRAERDAIARAQERGDALEDRKLRVEADRQAERQRRAGRYDPRGAETGAITGDALDASASQFVTLPALSPARRRIIPDEADLQKIIRYEAHLNRVLIHTLHELEALQARRKGADTPLARIDVTAEGGGMGVLRESLQDQ